MQHRLYNKSVSVHNIIMFFVFFPLPSGIVMEFVVE